MKKCGAIGRSAAGKRIDRRTERRRWRSPSGGREGGLGPDPRGWTEQGRVDRAGSRGERETPSLAKRRGEEEETRGARARAFTRRVGSQVSDV